MSHRNNTEQRWTLALTWRCTLHVRAIAARISERIGGLNGEPSARSGERSRERSKHQSQHRRQQARWGKEAPCLSPRADDRASKSIDERSKDWCDVCIHRGAAAAAAAAAMRFVVHCALLMLFVLRLPARRPSNAVRLSLHPRCKYNASAAAVSAVASGQHATRGSSPSLDRFTCSAHFAYCFCRCALSLSLCLSCSLFLSVSNTLQR